MATDYGHKFHASIVAAVPPHASWPSDLKVPFTDIADLLQSQDVGIGLLRQAQMKGLDIPSAKIHKLEAEIKDGKCIVQLGHDNSLERVVAVVALHIENNDGLIFVQVGKFDAAGGVSVTCVLPGKKRGKGEFPHETIKRVIENDLAPLS